MRRIEILTAIPLNANSWVAVAVPDVKAVGPILIQARTAVDMLLATSRTSGADYFTLKSGQSMSLDLEGGDLQEVLSSDKVSNGAFTGAATGWTVAVDWAYNANAMDHTAGAAGTLSQDISAVAGELYKTQYTISGYVAQNVTIGVGGASGTARTANGTYIEYLTAVNTNALALVAHADAVLTVDDVSVKKVLNAPRLYAKSSSGNIYLEIFRLIEV